MASTPDINLRVNITGTDIVNAASKPHLVNDLRKTWRKSTEHKAAQIKRFIYSMGAVLGANLMGDIAAHKDPLQHFTDLRTAWYYLIPFAYIAWKQAHPSLGASEVDSAPGVTIVPSQVGAAPLPDIADPAADLPPVEQTDNRPRPVDPDVTRPQSPGSVFVGQADADFDPDADPITPPDETSFPAAATEEPAP